MDDEEMAEILGDSFHSLLGVFSTASQADVISGRLLQENGSAVLQDDGSYILI